MPLYIAQSGDLDRCHRCLTVGRTHSQTLKDSATQLLIKYKNEARVTQCMVLIVKFTVKRKVVGGTVVGWDG